MKNETIVVLTYYKCQKYFKDQIDSIKNQTKVPDLLIVVNDSNDYLEEQYINNFNYGNLNVNIITNKHNYGCTRSIYIGLKYAYIKCAKYIWISDCDDIWLPDKIRLQYNELKKGIDICNHYSQKIINGEKSTINFANCAGHSLAFNASSFRKGINLIARPNFKSFNTERLKATYDSILSFIPLIYGLKWGVVDKVLVYHRLYNKEHYTINSEMHKSIIQDIKNFYNGICAYKNMKDYLDQNTTFKTSAKELFNYYRKIVNKYDLCSTSIRFKNSIFDTIGSIVLTFS